MAPSAPTPFTGCRGTCDGPLKAPCGLAAGDCMAAGLTRGEGVEGLALNTFSARFSLRRWETFVKPKVSVMSCGKWKGVRKDMWAGEGGGGGKLQSGSVKSYCEKLPSRNQTCRSLKEQHFCTGDIKGTNKHGQAKSNCGKLRKIAGLHPSPPPDVGLVCTPVQT